MSDSNGNRDRDPLVGLTSTSLPEDLRGQVLAAAEATFQEQRAPDLWSRLWSNPSLRLAWAAIAGLLLVGHVIITPSPSSPVRTAGGWVAGSISEFDVELQDIVNLPRISEDARVGLP